MRHTTAVVMLALSGCLINTGLYKERLVELVSDGQTDGNTDTDKDTDTGPDTAMDTADPAPIDADGDGWSVPEDCDDTLASINPDQCEICGDKIDQNCSGQDHPCHDTLDPSYDHVTSAFRFTGLGQNDNAGVSVGGAGDFDGDGYDDLVIGASRADRAEGDAPDVGNAYLILGPIEENQSLLLAYARFGGEDFDDRAGVSVAGKDFDGDGYSDLFVGAKFYGSDNGAVYVIPGGPRPKGGSPGAVPLVKAGHRLVGEAGSQAGFWVAGLPDASGDGIADLAIGAPLLSGGAGRVYLLPGGIALDYGGSSTLSTVATGLDGEAPGDEAGSQVEGVGDVDGDGLGELIVAAMKTNALSGSAYVVQGDSALWAPTIQSLSDATWRFQGETPGDRAGSSVGAGGDVDGDGLNDVIVGARRHSSQAIDQGAAYLITSNLMGSMDTSVALSLANVDAKILGETGNDRLGQSVAIVGDVDCDGYADLLLGADQYGTEITGFTRGAAYLLFGPVPQSQVELATAPNVVRFVGTDGANDKLGNHLAGVGDVDRDGIPDFALGAYTADVNSVNGVGAAWFVYGSGAPTL